MAGVSDMELFVHVASLGSLTKAAVRLDLTQSAASRRIAALEEKFGGRLFHRTGRGVRLTELGEGLLPRVKGVLGDMERLFTDARSLSGKPAGGVTLGVLPSVSRPFVRRLYKEASERFPDLRLQINEGFGGLLPGECSPMEAVRLAELVEPMGDDFREAFGAYVRQEHSGTVDESTVEAFEEAYCGLFDSEASYAEDLAEGIGAVLDTSAWPLSCIDWDRAWRELHLGGDNYSIDAPGGRVHIFRSV